MHRLHTFFIPHEGNNFRARALHHNFLAFYFLVGAFLLLASRLTYHGDKVLGFATDITVVKLHELTNTQRQKHNEEPVTLNDALSEAAELKGKDMLAHNYWAHYSPAGTAPWDFFKRVGYDYEFAGENLAKNFSYSSQVIDAWMASPGHRENLLRPDYTDVGFAVVNGTLNGEQTTVVVQMFGRPQNLAAQPRQEQAAPAAEETQYSGQPQVLQAVGPKPQFTLDVTPATIMIVLVTFLLVALFVDLYYAARLNVFRFHGKNVAHFVFLFFVLVGVFFFISRGGTL